MLWLIAEDWQNLEHRIEETIARKIEQIADLSLLERIHFWAEYFLGKPYLENPLGESENKPLIRFDGFDCITYVETCLALGLSTEFSSVEPNIIKIRYRDGRIDHAMRCHFVSLDWIPNNRDIIKLYSDNQFRKISLVIDRHSFFKSRGIEFITDLKYREKATMPYLPTDRLTQFLKKNEKSGIVFFLGSKDWLIVNHMGFLFTNSEENLLYHASYLSKKVEKEPINSYLINRNIYIGISIAEVKS